LEPGYQPDPGLIEQFNALEKKIDRAVALIAQLRKEKQELEKKVAELEKLRTAVIDQLNSIIDRIDSLL
jgi:phage shock protein A